MERFDLTLPGRQPASVDDELWRIVFQAPLYGELKVLRVDDVPRAHAEQVFTAWATRPDLWSMFCTDCAPGVGERCQHGPRPDGAPRGWLNSDIETMRIMPMREAL
jgi:hypothetical protein